MEVTDEVLEARIERLQNLNYTAPEKKKRKGKTSSVKASGTKVKSTAAKVKEAVKTGKVTSSDLDELEALMEKIKKGEL